MKVVILCGGMGTRLKEESEYRPKPLVDVGGRPILWHIMKLYAFYGFTEFVLCLGYKGHMIKEYFLNYDALNNDFTIKVGAEKNIRHNFSYDEQNFTVTLSDTGQNTQTGARIKHIGKYIDEDTFMVTYGDGLSNVNIADLLAFHKSHGRLATMTTVRPFSRFGVVEIEQTGQIKQFTEKPQTHSWANAGFFVFNRQVFNYISNDPNCVLEKIPLNNLAQDGQLMAYQHEGFFFAMDTYREYLQLNQMWEKGDTPWAPWRRV